MSSKQVTDTLNTEIFALGAEFSTTLISSDERKIGSILKKARCNAGYSLADVAEKINVKKQYLAALEEGDYNLIPARVYVQGYLKLYIDYLGLNITPEISNNDLVPPSNKNASLNRTLHIYLILLSVTMLIVIELVYNVTFAKEQKTDTIVEINLPQIGSTQSYGQ